LSISPELEFKSYQRASQSLVALIRGERYASDSTTTRRQRAEAKLERIREMLKAVGNPQDRYPVVHVTGTSGKGSTAASVATMLTAAGYRAGLHTSPYLQVATEKLQIGPHLIDAGSLAHMAARVLGTAAHLFPLEQAELPFSYAEAWSVLGYWWFADRDVDVAVVEVGAGGRFDPTNVIDPIVSVITSVGFDHRVTLGPGITDIAWHKAGIIKPGATAVVGELPDAALAVVSKEAQSASVDLIQAYHHEGPRLSFSSSAGGFQERNAEVATAVASVLMRLGFKISDAAIAEGRISTRLPGRLERMPGTAKPAIWIDGAHNEDKVAALAAEAVDRIGGGALPVIVVGMLSSKDASGILAKLAPVASSIVTTEPSVSGRDPLAAQELAGAVAASGFAGAVHSEPNPDAAVRFAEVIAKREGAPVLVTGSMYLTGQVRRRWFRDPDIVVQRTPWPASTEESNLRSP
jgi:dihydrofolate synthase/folylpolyglutamate synthase